MYQRTDSPEDAQKNDKPVLGITNTSKPETTGATGLTSSYTVNC